MRLLAEVHPAGDTCSCDIKVASHTRLLPVHTIRSAPPAGRTCLTGVLLPGDLPREELSGLGVAGLPRDLTPFADPHRLDAVVPHGLHPDREAIRVDGVPTAGQPSELRED